MKIIHVVGTISLESSGPSQSVPALCRGLMQEGVDVELHYLDYGGRPTVRDVATFPHDRTLIPGLRFAAWSLDLLASIWSRAQPGVILHSHGLWHFPTIYPAWVGGARGIPWVVSPRGTLGEWVLRQSRVKKTISLAIGQGFALRRAALLHATSFAEADDFRRFGLTNRMAVIPNGLDLEDQPTDRFTAPAIKKDVLFLSRLHPKKAVENLVRAWASVANDFADDSLVIAGPSERDYGETLERIIADDRIPRVRLVGELKGLDKWRAMSSAKVFVLPSHHENFGMVVAEALSVGTPVIASTGTPWESLETQRAGYWVPNDPANLGSALSLVLGLTAEERTRMGERGRDFVVREFSIRAVARRMRAEYERILSDTGHR